MVFKSGTSLLAAASMVALMASSPAAAQTIVDWVYIEANPDAVAVMESIARAYEAEHPDVQIRMQYLENEAFKAKLPTMLQSGDAPDIFYSWGGGVLAEQVRGGVLRSITEKVDAEWQSWIAPSALSAFTVDGEIYGVPVATSLVGFFYNKAMFEQAGVDAEAIQTWSDLMAAVDALKAAGLTPLTVGGQEGWPQHFYFSYLSARIAGHEKLHAALRGEGEGFTDPAFVEAFTKLKELADKEPFQDGWLASGASQSQGNFGNGKAAMVLQGNWARSGQANNSEDGKGLEDDLGWMPFPAVEGGHEGGVETLGGINGWIFDKNASDEAVDFMRFYSQPENLTEMARAGVIAPMPGIADQLDDPWQAMVATAIEGSAHHQNFFNVMFAEEVNRELLDIVTGVMTGDLTPEDGAQALQDAWEFSQ
jgi:raffinose/stachyose/melibiose transport system substrate-binding protein